MKKDGTARRSSGLCWWKIVLFAGCFAVVFGACQRVLCVKLEPKQKLTLRNQTYSSLPKNTVDVLFVGTSKFDHAISPNVLWNEAGIASFNMTGAREYYTFVEQNLLLAREMNNEPKYAVFIPTLLYRNKYYDDVQGVLCYKTWHAMPKLHQRVRMLFAYWRDLRGQQNKAGWMEAILPLFRFHQRWLQLTWEDFWGENAYEEINPPYCLGQNIFLDCNNVTELASNPKYLPNEELIGYGEEAWIRIFSHCEKAGITPVVVITPFFERVANDPLRQKAEALYERYGAIVYDYNTEEEIARMNWDYLHDFYDAFHLNLAGGAKLSADLAQKLSQLPGIEDHRGDERFAIWDECCDTYYANFQEQLVYALGEEGARRYNQ